LITFIREIYYIECRELKDQQVRKENREQWVHLDLKALMVIQVQLATMENRDFKAYKEFK
jgi:hypothetical protein